MSEIARKKDTGEPGNGGQFGTSPKPASGLSLGDAPAGRVVDQDVVDQVQYLYDQLTDNGDIDHARHDGEGNPREGFPQAEHAAAVDALRTYVQALRGEKVWGGNSTPFLVHPHIWGETEPLPAYPASLPEPQVSYELNDGLITTAVDLGDGRRLAVWGDDDTYTSEEHYGPDDPGSPVRGMDEETREAFLEWACEVHSRVDGAAYGAQTAAVNHTGFHDLTVSNIMSMFRRESD